MADDHINRVRAEAAMKFMEEFKDEIRRAVAYYLARLSHRAQTEIDHKEINEFIANADYETLDKDLADKSNRENFDIDNATANARIIQSVGFSQCISFGFWDMNKFYFNAFAIIEAAKGAQREESRSSGL